MSLTVTCVRGFFGQLPGEYIKVGHNEHFQVIPAIVHYGGYDIGCIHRQTVKVKNITDKSRRLHIIVPKTPFFKVILHDERVTVILPANSLRFLV